jgi:outer membrane biosynthesis protein TonB
VRVIKGSDPEVDAAAQAPLREWKFKPATPHGKPVPVYLTIALNVDLR